MAGTDDIKIRLLTDKKYFIENLVQIPDKNRIQVPFIFNPIQNLIYKELWLDQFTKRGLILKAGQMGCTSVIMALFLVDCITRPHTTSVVIAHEEFITQRLLQKAKDFESSIPEGLKPVMHHRSSYELSWEDIGSTFYIGSARSFVFGRGERIDNALCSEIAFWQDPDRIVVPLGERVPKEGRILFESTANGEINWYHDTWVMQKKLWNEGRGVYKPIFLPWWLCPEYRMKPDEGLPVDAHSPLDYTQEEQKLANDYHLTEEQIRWRRYKMGSPLGELFHQEYAENEYDCFMQVREAYFDQELLSKKALDCYPPVTTYDSTDVWEEPKEGHIYVIGADPTVGRQDNAAATVWDLLGLKLVARLRGLYEPPVFAEKIKALGLYYNKAMLVVESNNPGVAVLGYLMEYPNLYYQRDINTGRPTTKPGWFTTYQSRAYMLQQFRQVLPELIIHDIELVREARNFRYNGLNVESIGSDDIMMSALLALATRETAPSKKGLVGTWGWSRW